MLFYCVYIKISLKFVPDVPINNILSLVQIIAWRRSGDNALTGPMVALFTDAYASPGLNELKWLHNQKENETKHTRGYI